MCENILIRKMIKPKQGILLLIVWIYNYFCLFVSMVAPNKGHQLFQDTSSAGIGVVVRDSTGKVFAALLEKDYAASNS